jgi:hypothetical protein|tara:strand:+ start:2055 stop:2222 length:168 start_codon:yes stop_codon:yes gene_type:complete
MSCLANAEAVWFDWVGLQTAWLGRLGFEQIWVVPVLKHCSGRGWAELVLINLVNR